MTILDLSKEDNKRFCYLLLYFMISGAYLGLLETVSYSVFNINVGSEYLPIAFIIFPLFNFICSRGFIRFYNKLNKVSFYRVFNGLLVIAHVFMYLILTGVFEANVYSAVLLMVAFILVELVVLARIFLTQETLDINGIKRMTPIIDGGSAIGAITMAVVLNLTKGAIGTETIFIFFAVFLVGSTLVTDILLKKHRILVSQNKRDVVVSYKDGFDYIRENKFLTKLIIIFSLVFIGYVFVNFQFNNYASAHYSDMNDLSLYFSRYIILKYVLSLVVNMLILSKLTVKLGSIKVIIIGLYSSIIAIVLMLFGKEIILLASVSKGVYWVLGYNLCAIILQSFYKLIDVRYKQIVITIINNVSNFIGFTLGGIVLIVFSYGGINILILNLLTVVMLMVVIRWWKKSDADFISIIRNNLNGTEDINVVGLIGVENSTKYIDHIIRDIEMKSENELEFIIELLLAFDYKGKERVLMAILLLEKMKLQVEIIDIVFERRLSAFDFNILSTCSLESNAYFLKKLVLCENREFVQCELDCIKTSASLSLRIKTFLKTGSVENYESILKYLVDHKSADHFKYIMQICTTYEQVHHKLNMLYIKVISEEIISINQYFSDYLSLINRYDAGLINSYIVERVEGSYDTKTMKSLVRDDYEYEMYVHSESPLNNALALIMFDRRINNHELIYYELMGRIESITLEICKLKRVVSNHKLLVDDLEDVIDYIEYVLVVYLLRGKHIEILEDLDRHLKEKEKRELLIEMMSNVLNPNDFEMLKKIIFREYEEKDRQFDYEALKIGDKDDRLYNVYMNIGGMAMDAQVKNEIDQLKVLKDLPIFSDLNIEMLYKLERIARYKKTKVGEKIIAIGEESKEFYVILEGTANVFVNVNNAPVAVISKGDIIGELGVINKEPRNATVESVDACNLLVFQGEEFLMLMDTYSSISRAVIKTLSKRLSGMLKDLK